MPDKMNFFADNDARIAAESAITAAVSSLDGIEIVEIRYFKEYGKPNLTVYIWKKTGVDLDVCEQTHNAISDALDSVEELFPSEYVLNVSSSGLDRPIVTDDDFRRALDTEIEVVGEKKIQGTLTAFTAEEFTVVSGDKTPKENIIKRDNTIRVQSYIRF